MASLPDFSCSYISHLLQTALINLIPNISKTTTGLILFLLIIIVCLLLLILLLVLFMFHATRDAVASYRRIEAEWQHLEEVKQRVAELFHQLYDLILGHQFRQMIRYNVREVVADEQIEQDLRREKSSNIILSGVRETGAHILDKEIINEILNICDDKAFPVHIFERFGFITSSGQPRRIRVKLSSSYRKARIMSGVNKLADHAFYEHVEITDDLTPRQDRERRERENGVIIVNGLLVSPAGPPIIVQNGGAYSFIEERDD